MSLLCDAVLQNADGGQELISIVLRNSLTKYHYVDVSLVVYLVRKNIVHREKKKKYSKLTKQQWKHFIKLPRNKIRIISLQTTCYLFAHLATDFMHPQKNTAADVLYVKKRNVLTTL